MCSYDTSNKGYNTDFNNLAPIVGIAWRPNAQSGFLRALLGDPELATINAGYTRSFVRTRLDQFLNVYNGNPGRRFPPRGARRRRAFPLVLPGESWPILFSQKSRLGRAGLRSRRRRSRLTRLVRRRRVVFNPDIQVPWTDSWNVSFQRSLTKDTVVEIRYQGNKGYKAVDP